MPRSLLNSTSSVVYLIPFNSNQMCLPPDLSTWAVMESLSFHEIACLCIGMNPTYSRDGKFSPPSVPHEFLDSVDEQNDYDQEYKKVYQLLLRAANDKVIISSKGRMSPKVAIDYLAQRGKMQNSDWIERCEFAGVVKSLRPNSNEVNVLKARILELESEVARYRARTTYTTQMLDLVNEVIDLYYSEKKITDYPGQKVVFHFLSSKKINTQSLSQKKIESIWAVASHPSQSKGGNKPLK